MSPDIFEISKILPMIGFNSVPTQGIHSPELAILWVDSTLSREIIPRNLLSSGCIVPFQGILPRPNFEISRKSGDTFFLQFDVWIRPCVGFLCLYVVGGRRPILGVFRKFVKITKNRENHEKSRISEKFSDLGGDPPHHVQTQKSDTEPVPEVDLDRNCVTRFSRNMWTLGVVKFPWKVSLQTVES